MMSASLARCLLVATLLTIATPTLAATCGGVGQPACAVLVGPANCNVNGQPNCAAGTVTTVDQLSDVLITCTVLLMFALGWIAGKQR
jgi:hypothetical protein